ncbi:MAG: ABC transporter permease [Nocardioides sp.]|nr:ABC transporter permease [Nocardioides sp.]
MDLLSLTWDYLTTADSWTAPGGILERLVEQLLLTVTALVVACALALPAALWLGHLGRGGFLAINVSNVGRAVPTFALLALLVTAPWPGVSSFGPYGRAGLATLIALVLFALPPLITNAYTAVREVPADVREAADGMGMSGWQRFRRVELPLALPLVLSGVRLALVQIWATATIAALVAGPGMGRIVVDGFARDLYSQGVGAALVVALAALVLEVTAALVQRWADPVPREARTGG